MAKEVRYYRPAQSFYIVEEGQETEDGKLWQPCPYDPITESQKIDNLAKQYTNGLNAAE
jgi:hypothetical protein